MKQFFCVVLTLILLLALPTVAFAAMPDTPATETAFYAADYAELFSEETHKAIIVANQSMRTENGAEIVVITTDNTEGMTAAEFAAELGRRWRVGSVQFQNGAVIVINKTAADYALCLGNGNEALYDEMTAALSAALTAERVASGYDAPFCEFFNTLVAKMREGAGGELDYYKKHNDYTFTGFRQNAAGGMNEADAVSVGFTVFFFICCAAVIALISVSCCRRNYVTDTLHRFPFSPFLMINGLQPKISRRGRF